MNTWFVYGYLSYVITTYFLMHVQRLGEILDAKALSADELIERHLKTLAKWTVCDHNNYFLCICIIFSVAKQ